MAQRIGLFGVQIWGIWRNGPNDSEGNFAFYAEEHGLGQQIAVTGRRSAPASSSLGKEQALERGLAFAMGTKRVYFCNEDET